MKTFRSHQAVRPFRFAHRRLDGHPGAGLDHVYQISGNLPDWREVQPFEESAVALPASVGYEVTTLCLDGQDLEKQGRLFLKISDESP